MKTTTPRPVLLAFVAAVFLFLSPLRAQMIIDSWGFTTGVDTTLWMDLGEDYTVLFSTNNGYQYHNYASSGLRDIGFPFTLGATTHTKFSTNVNGTVRLGTAPLSTVGYINEPLGQNINAGPRIDALGRAGLIDTSCYMRSAVLGDSGSRILVVEARLREYADRGSAEGHYVHFQVQLFEAEGSELYQRYRDVEGVRVGFVEDFPVSDSIACDVTVFEALTDEGWEWMQDEFQLHETFAEWERMDSIAEATVGHRPDPEYSLNLWVSAPNHPEVWGDRLADPGPTATTTSSPRLSSAG
ncbi:MAG: hypothetical protein SPL12_00390 [Bacteroidales bacterium]|nr:hypothetical protein [Bacteroidales bacterium]